MTKEEIDILWQKAMQESIKDGQMYTRYHFAKLVAERTLADPMREVQRFGQEIEQEPVCPDCKAKVLYECVACSSNNYPPQRTEQEPVIDKSAAIRIATVLGWTPPRTWVGLTDEEFQWVYDHGRTPAGMMEMVEAKLEEKNT